MQIEVCKGDAAHSPLNTGDCSNPDCAVATQYEDDAVGFVERIGNPCRSRPDHIGDSPEVLSPGAGAIGSPRNDVRVTEVGHLKPHGAELLNESRVTQCLRTLVLTDAACAGPRGGADDRCLPHDFGSPAGAEGGDGSRGSNLASTFDAPGLNAASRASSIASPSDGVSTVSRTQSETRSIRNEKNEQHFDSSATKARTNSSVAAGTSMVRMRPFRRRATTWGTSVSN